MPLNINAAAQSVKLDRYGHTTDWSNRTWILKAGIVAADVGKAVAFDSANTVKLAGAGDRVIGVLETVENRVNEGTLVGTVKMVMAGVKLKIKAADPLAAGDMVVGGGGGEVQQQDTEGFDNLMCVAVESGYATVYNV